jgi:hypothetical protein
MDETAEAKMARIKAKRRLQEKIRRQKRKLEKLKKIR